ncbi:hypothetical protein J5N97_008509 [Dioscorea zingiberensis]|uniref:Uncharacterized protein n=1 Tax=Dioscorea zingiberensis TaxID=325984 RepID=A0A9D5HKV2_9LILI|nr:hypothetical protein J5N97_008509 [Dioscorea zingiberensis]
MELEFSDQCQNGKSKSPVMSEKSKSKSKSKSPVEAVSLPVQPIIERRRRKKKVKKLSDDEFSKIRKRVQYLLKRIGYEQNLIDAYSGEGWKGQSLEKIKPEKELERAKSEILRCKLKIRELFHHLDSLLSKGRLEDSLFDSEGQISSDDIFCGTCSSKDVSANNDIILCDGICDRGFHQKCLNPPLLSENIPSGDEGWLCPACDCKVDCLDLLNEFQESDLNIENTWENVFPEVAATSNSGVLHDESGFLSDDSEDDDYDPDVPVVDEEDQEEGESLHESDSTSLSEESEGLKHEMQHKDLGLSSDDSEDDDYDPDRKDTDEKTQKARSSSDESDFSSDSDDFCAVLSKASGANEVSESSKPSTSSGEGRRASERNKFRINSEPLSLSEPNMNQETVLPMLEKRQHEHLDYKKLCAEVNGKTSDSSDDENWLDINTKKKNEEDVSRKGPKLFTRKNAQPTKAHKGSRGSKGKLTKDGGITNSGLDQPQASQDVNESTPMGRQVKSKAHLVNMFVADRLADTHGHDSNGNTRTTPRRSIGRTVSQKLLESFRENQYPARGTKERLAAEHGITFQQVSKWFENTRRSMRACTEGVHNERIDTTKQVITPQAASQSVINNMDEVLAIGSSQTAVITPPKSTATTSSLTRFTTPSKTAGLANPCGTHNGYSLDNGQKSVSIQGKRKKSVEAGTQDIRDASASNNEDKTRELIDKDRQKAIARELRKRRKSM